jgi:putative NADH-flavin reductase
LARRTQKYIQDNVDIKRKHIVAIIIKFDCHITELSIEMSAATRCFVGAKPIAKPSSMSVFQQRSSFKAPLRRASHMRIAAEFDPDNASILVGGGGGVALDVTRKLKDCGSWVWQLQRTDVRRKEIEGMMAIVVNGDAMNPEDIEKAFTAMDDEVDAVVSSIGGTTADPTADSVANINLIEAAAKHGVKKFILITSIGTGDSKNATPPNVYDALKPVLIEKEKAEKRLQELGASTGMKWVIIRPGGLKTEAPTGKGVLTENKTVCGAITRADVAELVVKALRSDKADNKILSAVDAEQVFGTPSYEPLAL